MPSFSLAVAPRRCAAALLLLVSLACAGADPLPPPNGRPVASIGRVSGADQTGIAGVRLGDSVVVQAVDAQGAPVANAVVRFAAGGNGSASPASAATDAEGRARTLWTLGALPGEQTLTANVGTVAPLRVVARAETAPPTVTAMLGELDQTVASSLAGLENTLSRNPQLAGVIGAKIALLRRPTLAGDIIRGRLFAERAATSASGRQVRIAVVFPLEALREEANASLASLAAGLPVLEGFYGIPFPESDMRVWQGFSIGSSGGGGRLWMEDRASYESHAVLPMPYDAIVLHEMSHSYVSNESLNQFLELYQFNLVHGATTDVRTWTWTRDWTPGLSTNVGVHALLDVYQLVGPEVMARAYRAICPFRPVNGQPLSAELRQAFVDQVPAELKAQVAAKLATIQS